MLPIEVSDEMMPGVVSIPHGWGHDRVGNQLEVAEQHAGESINDLTDNQAVDALCGTAAFNGTPVTVDAYQASRHARNTSTPYAIASSGASKIDSIESPTTTP